MPRAHMVVVRKDFAWKDTRSSWRNANSRLRQKIYEEWRRRRARRTQREWISQAQKSCQLPDCVLTKVKKDGITGRGGRHWWALDTVTHDSTTRKGNCWQYPAKHFVAGGELWPTDFECSNFTRETITIVWENTSNPPGLLTLNIPSQPSDGDLCPSNPHPLTCREISAGSAPTRISSHSFNHASHRKSIKRHILA